MPIQISILLVAFFMTIISGIILIPMLTRLKFGQIVRDDGPQTHLKKMGTPTMGGVIFLIPMVIIGSYMSFSYSKVMPVLLATLLFGLVGFIDDYIKVVLKRSKGLSSRQKMLGLLIISAGFAYYIVSIAGLEKEIIVPFTDIILNFSEVPIPFTNKMINLEWLFIPFIIIVMLSTTNSVNLTDGLDGLAAGICMMIMVFFTIVSLAVQNIDIIIFSSLIVGGCLGFLAFNMNPARIFMGDTGSLALGGAIACVGIVMKLPLVIIIVAGVCVLEAVSVIIQVMVFKLTGKRVFKMAPIHHHFELLGWRENMVVWTFWAVTAILCVVGVLSIQHTII